MLILERKIQVKKSIRKRLILILLVFIVGIFVTNIVMNFTLLEKYYTYEKEKTFGVLYKQANDICLSDELTDENKYYALDKIAANSGVMLYVFSVYYDGIYNNYSFKYPDVKTESKPVSLVLNQVDDYVNDYYGFKSLDKNHELIKSTEYYNVFRTFDNRIDSNYLELFGKMDKTTFVFIRANYQNMRESAELTNKFAVYIGIIALIIGTIAMSFIGNGFTKPILRLAKIADRMAELDFEVKYEGSSDDEIGQLGKNMNVLAEKLEETISELKGANNELQHDIEKKQEIDEMRQEFLSNVSHELKTPIALIQGYAEGLCDGISDDPEDREFYCNVIMDEAKKMNRMVKHLLDLNQLESGTDKPNFERFDIVQVITSVANSSEIRFRQKGAELIMYEPNPVYVWADEYLVEQVLTNYVSNALNHVSGDMKIEIYTEKMANGIRVCVKNTGDKIPEDDIDKIWDKFYKVDKARTREYGGNGIGLSIVKAIMNSFNRECGVNNCDDGVLFWFELDSSNA